MWRSPLRQRVLTSLALYQVRVANSITHLHTLTTDGHLTVQACLFSYFMLRHSISGFASGNCVRLGSGWC
jgi:hypothetical protein